MTRFILKSRIKQALVLIVLGSSIILGSSPPALSAHPQFSQQVAPRMVPRMVQCGDRDQIVKLLDQRFKEVKFAMGLASNVNLFEVFLSKKGTWTILSTRANGKTCIVAAGKSWVSMPAIMKGDAVSF